MIRGFQFRGLLQNTGWIEPAYVTVNDFGIIRSISTKPFKGTPYQIVEGYAIPGMVNAHSHSFQYAMAGLNEHHGSVNGADTFWTWRQRMYEIALKIHPEELENIAAWLYSEMIRHGYTHVIEFHYLHHDVNGKPYEQKAELGMRLVSAAKSAGIRITLIPIFYQKGGFGKEPLKEQRRFISDDIDEYLTLFESSNQVIDLYENALTAYGLHSLRAVEPEDLRKISGVFLKGIPVHLHISEQKKEVEQSLEYLKSRPVEWLLDNVDVDENYNLIHATHLDSNETIGLARSNANVVLCPSTEGNLGDGFFNFHEFQNHHGNWCIGTDSHIGLNMFEELRLLDYGQRLTVHNRNTFADQHSTGGAVAIQKVVMNGRAAAGVRSGDFFEIDHPLDCLVLNARHPLLANTTFDNLTNTIIYSSDPSMNLGTIIKGKWVVREHIHVRFHELKENFESAIQSLKIR